MTTCELLRDTSKILGVLVRGVPRMAQGQGQCWTVTGRLDYTISCVILFKAVT